MLNTPILFAINAGVSLAFTVVFPRYKLPYSKKKSTTSELVFEDGIISSNFKYRGGLKKWVPQKLA